MSHCPKCQQASTLRQETQAQEVQFDICARCGLIWIDFGAQRPRLHRSVEEQVARWDNLRQLLGMTESELELERLDFFGQEQAG